MPTITEQTFLLRDQNQRVKEEIVRPFDEGTDTPYPPFIEVDGEVYKLVCLKYTNSVWNGRVEYKPSQLPTAYKVR